MFLGVDIGTGSTKGVVVDDAGVVLARAERAHQTSSPRPGWFEHDAVAVWWQDFTAVVAELSRRVDLAGVAGLAVSGIGPCLLAADQDGRPLRPAILYGVDTRATREIAELTDEFGADQVLAVGGSPLTSQAVGPKLRWLRRHEPEVWQRTRRLLMASSYLVHRLTGEYVLDHHSASQCTPLYDLAGTRWHEPALERLAPDLAAPRLAWPGEVVGTVHAEAASATGLPVGLPVLAGTIDAWAEATSVGVREPGDVMVMYGSTMFLVAMCRHALRHPRLWGTVGVRPGTYSLAAGMATSGTLTDWVRTLTGASYAELLAAAEQVPPGARGLLVLPYFAGERTPLFDPHARGVIAGLTLHHGRGELYRAVLEATAFGVRHNLDTMREAGAEPNRLVAVGGGTRGGLWPRIVSAVLGLPQQVPTETVGAAYGDAVLAADAAGVDTRGWNATSSVVEPDPDWQAHYARRYPDYLDLYPRTRDTVHTLAEAQLADERLSHP
ncbi:FGGY-family carbohydrate kinase [Goodfellowiella coeruleoviolacea]|uniref:Xylulokinase n=1 Tax=Goodfellowiella coeruleoviolacea TaxID=334858 RepID=A0AAE3G9H1_9PSEU|nr:FGGY-family carbohydrate kinase [Goodfellowiella coeruleoviolacea]MCP2164141.1 xylulokinase [Goodfellowiella coeruleoviolacea]